MTTSCPACQRSMTEVFLSLHQLPVHGTAVCDTREQALELARGDQVLAVCHACGFVFNTAFNPRLLDYSGHHEESQAFSPTFKAFATGLAEGWVERYALQEQTVVEVGCGKGDFLRLLSSAGVGRAHGVDPGLHPSRLPLGGAVTGEVAEFAPSELSRSASAVVCRHTLEHIPAVDNFLYTVIAGVDPEVCRALLFELPDLGRVLDEAAFWDLHYEHCSSFTATSLAGLFHRHGLDVLDLRLVYADQYLVIEADPKAGRSRPAQLDLAPVEEVVARCRDFARDVERELARWGAWFAERARAGREVVIWGGGSKGVVFLSALPECGVRRVVDINPGLHGHWMGGAGVPIVAPSELVREPPATVLLMNGIYQSEVREMLDQLGLEDVELEAV